MLIISSGSSIRKSPFFFNKSHISFFYFKENYEFFYYRLYTVLPKTTPNGDSIMLTRLTDPNPDRLDLVNLFKLNDCVLTLNLHQHGPHDGLQVISDMKNVTMGHLPRMNLMVMKKALIYIQVSQP